MENNNYVKPPSNPELKKTLASIKGAYKYLHPDYWKRKLVHLLIVVPCVLTIYSLIFSPMVDDVRKGSAFYYITSTIFLIIVIGLTLISAYFYPFSLWWYKQSFIGNLLNSIVYVGGFFAVIGKAIATVIGGIVIAGTLAPIMGPLTLRKCKKKNLTIGDASDF